LVKIWTLTSTPSSQEEWKCTRVLPSPLNQGTSSIATAVSAMKYHSVLAFSRDDSCLITSGGHGSSLLSIWDHNTPALHYSTSFSSPVKSMAFGETGLFCALKNNILIYFDLLTLQGMIPFFKPYLFFILMYS
jgi:WD40 repeat protein